MIDIELTPTELYTLWKILTLSKLGGAKSLSSDDLHTLEDILYKVELEIVERQTELEQLEV